MKLINRTPYPAREVRRIVEQAMGRKNLASTVDSEGRPLTRDWLVVTVILRRWGGQSGKGRHHGIEHPGQPNAKRRVWRTSLFVGGANEYPIEQDIGGRGLPKTVTYRNWQEDLFVTAAHEAAHIFENANEHEAEAEALGRLRGFRVRRLIGLA